MNESLDNAIQELKRIDHLVFVSLKYTRTVDVIKNIITRVINCFDFGLDTVLEYAKEKKMIEEIPISPVAKCELTKKIFADNEELVKYVEFYSFLRVLDRSSYQRHLEYRRHVAMVVVMEGEVFHFGIDAMHEYYEKSKQYIEFIRSFIEK